MRKIIILSLLTLTLAGIVIYKSGKIYAQTPTPINPIQTIVQKLAQKFGLKETDVQSVFDEVRQEKQKLMQQRFEERLNQAVADGKITEFQKQLILTKHKEIAEKNQTLMQNWQNMTSEERRVEKEKQRAELEDWAKQNNIDPSFIFGKFGIKRFGMMGPKGGHWEWGYK